MRNRPGRRGAARFPRRNGQELVLRLSKSELFDPYIVLPHAEVNPVIYDAVNQFVEKYAGETMLLTVISDPVSEVVQNIFRESFRLHYEDECRKVSRFLEKRIMRVVFLLLTCIASFWGSGLLRRFTEVPDYVATIVGQISLFCLWEIGHTHLDRIDGMEERKRIIRAQDAVIEFLPLNKETISSGQGHGGDGVCLSGGIHAAQTAGNDSFEHIM